MEAEYPTSVTERREHPVGLTVDAGARSCTLVRALRCREAWINPHG